MGESDTIPKVPGRETAVVRSPVPWWVAEVKWLLTGYVFPSAVVIFLLWSGYTVQTKTVQVLESTNSYLKLNLEAQEKTRAALDEIRNRLNRNP